MIKPNISSRVWIENIGKSLAYCWPEFVNCPKRLETEGPFLDLILHNYNNPKILDAATGIGCEAIYLLNKGYNLIGNEICPELSERALNYCRSERLNLVLYNFDWRDLDAHYIDYFDIVVSLGNSLSLLRDYRDRLETAKNFKAICRAGASVIIDERNFKYILENREEILKGNFRYSGKVVYCGEKIVGYPVFIQDDCVRFVYQHTETEEIYGALDMHPFARGEIVDLFFSAGFTHVDIFSDFKSGYSKEADFYTYVFK